MKVSCALYIEIEAEEELASLDWDSIPKPLMVLGGGSNLLFKGDFPGTVLHYGDKACASGTPFASLTPAPPTVRLVHFVNGQPAGPSPYTCPGVDKPPGTLHLSLNASGSAKDAVLTQKRPCASFCTSTRPRIPAKWAF